MKKASEKTEFIPNKNPYAQFRAWFQDAVKAKEPIPEAMALTTAGKDWQPSARMVLLKSVSQSGFVFFTNYQSRKSMDIAENPRVSLLFHWPLLERQVLVEGEIEKTSRRESETYFASRPRESQLGAWASPQSTAIKNNKELRQRFELYVEKFSGQPVPCPPHWGGFRITPERFEFWQGRPHRLHERQCYYRSGKGWKIAQLAP